MKDGNCSFPTVVVSWPYNKYSRQQKVTKNSTSNLLFSGVYKNLHTFLPEPVRLFIFYENSYLYVTLRAPKAFF